MKNTEQLFADATSLNEILLLIYRYNIDFTGSVSVSDDNSSINCSSSGNKIITDTVVYNIRHLKEITNSYQDVAILTDLASCLTDQYGLQTAVLQILTQQQKAPADYEG